MTSASTLRMGAVGAYAWHIARKRKCRKFRSITNHTCVCLHRFHRITLSWVLMSFVSTYSWWCKLIQQFPLKLYKDQWKQNIASSLRIRRFGWPSKRPLVRFMAIGKSFIISFQNGYKVCKHLTYVQLFNWWLSYTMSKILLTIVVSCSIIYSRHLPLVLKHLNIASH